MKQSAKRPVMNRQLNGGNVTRQQTCVVTTYSHRPVDAQVQRDEDEVVEENVDSLGPALHRRVSSVLPASSQLREEEGAERVDF